MILSAPFSSKVITTRVIVYPLIIKELNAIRFMMSWTISISFSIYSFRLSLFSIFIISLQGTVLRITSLTIPEHDSHISLRSNFSPFNYLPLFSSANYPTDFYFYLIYYLFLLLTWVYIIFLSSSNFCALTAPGYIAGLYRFPVDV